MVLTSLQIGIERSHESPLSSPKHYLAETMVFALPQIIDGRGDGVLPKRLSGGLIIV
jgi:hypothetical protein